MFKILKEEIEVNGKKLTLETGKVARQADGAIMATLGETVVIATAVGAKKVADGQDYFPLSVNYQEKYYAAGKIPGGYFKREARPTEAETLISRLIDRPIRPLFPSGFMNEVQVLPTVLSYDNENQPDIAMGVDSKDNKDEGAGDQGIMFGYACTETDDLMPAPIHFSHKILRLMASDRKSGALQGIEPDSKSQVTMLYEKNKPVKVTSVVISTQHSKDLNQQKVRELIIPYIEKSIPKNYLDGLNPKEVYINPTGQFIIGGPDGDTGLTGRKIIVDTYGGAAPHGGGAFSGKDPTKVDRSAAYASRYLAKNIVSSGASNKCLIQLAYAIGVSKPLSIFIKLADEDEAKVEKIKKIVNQNFDLSPRGIREMLKLNNPIYEVTSAYGHFGRKPGNSGEFSWEKTDKVDLFKL